MEQGLLQAKLCPEMVGVVRKTVLVQLNKYKELFQSDKNRYYLKEQIKITKKFFPEVIEEVKGLARGFKLKMVDLFCFYHLRILLDMDGCTSWAVSLKNEAILGKNRDLADGSHALQRVFIHQDPDRQHKKVLSVGSLGSPCAYSSGINSKGFSLADTSILTLDHGLGACRYFLMPFLLRTCSSVDQALKKISDLPHAGGGSLTMADQNAVVAVVELGHYHQDIEKNKSWQVKTNHFTSDLLSSSNVKSGRQSNLKNSTNRLNFMNTRMPDIYQNFDLKKAIELVKSHDQKNVSGICRHPGKGRSSTISSAIYTCTEKKLSFSDGNPCNSYWYKFSL